MDPNSLRQQLLDAQKKAIDYQTRQSTFGDELQKAIGSNDAAYAPYENDVNSKRNSYYNSFGTVLPQVTAQKPYSNDPTLALQRLEAERSAQGTSYQNAQDALLRKKQSLTDLINSSVNAGNAQLTKQNSLVDLFRGQLQDALAEEDRKRQAASQAAYLASLKQGAGSPGDGAPTQRTPRGQRDSTGRIVAGYDENGNVYYEPEAQSKNFIQQFGDLVGNKNAVNNAYTGIQTAASKIPGIGGSLNQLLSNNNVKNVAKAGLGTPMGYNLLGSLYSALGGR